MGSTGLITKKPLIDVFNEEFEYLHYKQNILATVLVPIDATWRDDDCDEEAEIYTALKTTEGVLCMVTLIGRYDKEVIYKSMLETDGPFTKTRCPKEVADLLTSLNKIEEHGYAGLFRKRHGISF